MPEKKPEAAPTGRLVTATNQSVVRQLRLTLQGVAPTDLDLANFMSQLSAVPFFEQVGMILRSERSLPSDIPVQRGRCDPDRTF